MKEGDHLTTARTGYTHHGIYVGNDRVVHYSGFADGPSAGPVEETSLRKFANGAEVKVINHPARIFDHHETVARAFEKLGEDEYSLVWNNCEHFAMWCIFGVKVSPQVIAAGMAVPEAFRLAAILRQTTQAGTVVMKSEALAPALAKVATSVATKSLVTGAASTLGSAGVASAAIAGGVTTGTLTAGLTAAVATVSGIAPAVAAVTVVGYGVKKLFDWFSD